MQNIQVAFGTSGGGCLTVRIAGPVPEWISQRGAQLATVEKRVDGSVRLLINGAPPGVGGVYGGRDVAGRHVLQFTRESPQRTTLLNDVGFFGLTTAQRLQTVGDSLEIIVPNERGPLIRRGKARGEAEAAAPQPAAATNGSGGSQRVRVTDVKAAVARVNELAEKYGDAMQLRVDNNRLHAGIWQDIH